MTEKQVYSMTHIHDYNLIIFLRKNRKQYYDYHLAIIHYLDII